MVSNYKRTTDRGSYSKDKLREAAQAVKNGSLSGYKASQLYNIPRMTIMDCVNNRRRKSNTLGRNTALAPEAEAMLANGLKLMEKYGFGLSRKEVLETVGEYVEKNNISTNFKNGIPGQAWFAGFKNRHNLSIKKPQAVEYARKKAIDPFIVYPYFNLLKNTLEELNLTEKPEAIWNMDETSFSKDPGKTKTVGAKGYAATRVISSPGRDNTTVLLCANALGGKAPPMIVYKGKNVWDSWVSPDAYPNTSYAATENGWMESEIFEKYFIKTFLPAIGNQRPILLIYDGHATHVGLNIIMKAREAGVTILKLPAHTSHVLQPLDVSLMKSFKDRWDELLVKWQRLHVGVILPKAEFARLIGAVWKQTDCQILKSGFRKAGIFPYNIKEIAEKNFDSLKLQRWRQHLATISTENSATIATEHSPIFFTEHSGTIATENSDIIVAKNTPKSLLSLALDCIEREAFVASVQCDRSGQSVNTHQIQENLSVALNEHSAKNPERTAQKIQILENIAVSFEDLLLMKVKAGNNETVKRRKIAPGAEVITHENVLKRKIEEHTKNIKKEPQRKKGKGVGKKSRDIEKENREENNNNPGAEVITHEDVLKRKIEELTENIKKQPQTNKGNGNGVRKKSRDSKKKIREKKINKPKIKKWSNKVISPDSTSVSDCVSIHSDSDAIDCDENIFVHMMSPRTMKEKENNKELNEICNSSDRENKVAMEDSNTPDRGNETEKTEDENNLVINDNVLVRYYSRKKWTYYVGYVEGIKAAEEVHYTIRFYKTVKSPLKFVLTKKIDCDDVPLNSVVKKVHLIQAPNNSKEFVLSDNVDMIYFSETEKNKESNEICNSSDRADRENKLAMEGSNTPDRGNETEKTEDENNLAINDNVLVRYYSRKKWTYYVGYVEGIKAAEEVHYTIRFYKTVKSPLKFVLTKKIDCDDVPLNSVVKKVHLIQAPNNSKEFLLSDYDDMIFFS